MSDRRRLLLRSGLVAALMTASSVASVVAVPRAKLADTRPAFDLERAVPKQFGVWRLDESVVPLPPSPDQQRVLDEIYDQILSRTYINDKGERVMVSMTYGSKQNQQLRAHRQEVCYAAQGFKISRLEHPLLPLGGGTVSSTRMVATQGARVEPVTYWFTTGDAVVRTYMERELAQLKYTLSGYVPDGYLVRLSSLTTDADGAFRTQIDFANELFRHLDPELRRRLTGAA
jgi:EpsI family protein